MKMKLLIATTNKGKLEEIEKLFRHGGLDISLHCLRDFGITADCPETGETFEENAARKSQFYSRMVPDMLTAGDDSGLAVDLLDGRPGVHSARYAGLPSDDKKNTRKLLDTLAEETNRTARFVTVVALSRNGAPLESFRGEVEGTIIHEERGSHGFGYDPVFYYPPMEKTFAQLTTEEKNKFSHRARAFRKLLDYLKKQ